MNKKIIIIIVVAVVLIGGGLAAFMLLSGGDEGGAPVTDLETYFPLGENLVTNTADGDKTLIKATIVLGLLNAPDVTEDFTIKMHVIRDVVVYTLRSRTKEQLVDVSTMPDIKAEIASRLNEELGVDYVHTVYFNDFVVT